MYNHYNQFLLFHTCTCGETHTQCKATATEADYAISEVLIRLEIEEVTDGRATNDISKSNHTNNNNNNNIIKNKYHNPKTKTALNHHSRKMGTYKTGRGGRGGHKIGEVI